jgi:hypothetical protein
MLTTETRQALQSLVNHKCISSVSVSDYRGFNGGIDNSITIHAEVDADRSTVLSLIDSAVGCTTKELEPQEARYGTQVTPYELCIEGSVNYMSYLYFSETEKRPQPQTEVPKENILTDSITEWSIEEILRHEG